MSARTHDGSQLEYDVGGQTTVLKPQKVSVTVYRLQATLFEMPITEWCGNWCPLSAGKSSELHVEVPVEQMCPNLREMIL